MYHTYSTRLCFVDLYIFVYVAVIQKQLLFNYSMIYTFYLYLKHSWLTMK